MKCNKVIVTSLLLAFFGWRSQMKEKKRRRKIKERPERKNKETEMPFWTQ